MKEKRNCPIIEQGQRGGFYKARQQNAGNDFADRWADSGLCLSMLCQIRIQSSAVLPLSRQAKAPLSGTDRDTVFANELIRLMA
jgi:hypothetical protein